MRRSLCSFEFSAAIRLCGRRRMPARCRPDIEALVAAFAWTASHAASTAVMMLLAEQIKRQGRLIVATARAI